MNRLFGHRCWLLSLGLACLCAGRAFGPTGSSLTATDYEAARPGEEATCCVDTPGEVRSLTAVAAFEDPEVVWIDLGTTNTSDGMTHPQTYDGDTIGADMGGRNCRRNTDPGGSPADNYFYFAVSDDYAYQGNHPDQYITIEYYDTGSGELQLQYDSNTGDDIPARYKDGGSVSLTGANVWSRHTYHVNDAYFGNRQNAGADFRIAQISGDYFYLDLVQVSEQAPSGNSPPFAIIDADPTGGLPPLAVDFDGSGSYDPDGTVVLYQWDFESDGTVDSNDPAPSHTYNDYGLYVAALTVTDDDNLTNSTIVGIDVAATVTITNLNRYFETTYSTGSTCFSDRPYTITSMPAYLEGRQGIKTANDDKDETSETWITFDVDREAEIYIAYDRRATSLPNWMNGYVDTGDTIGVSDALQGYARLYRKAFCAGGVVLGANNAPGASGYGSSYFVLVLPRTTLPVSVPQANPTQGNAPLTVFFDGSDSCDPDGTIVSYEWDFESDGTIDDTGVTTGHQYASAGVYTAELIVTDDDTNTDSAVLTIDVGGAPAPEFTEVASFSSYGPWGACLWNGRIYVGFYVGHTALPLYRSGVNNDSFSFVRNLGSGEALPRLWVSPDGNWLNAATEGLSGAETSPGVHWYTNDSANAQNWSSQTFGTATTTRGILAAGIYNGQEYQCTYSPYGPGMLFRNTGGGGSAGVWSQYGPDITPTEDELILEIQYYNGQLYLGGGRFDIYTQPNCARVVRYTGSSWEQVFNQTSNLVCSSAIFDGKLWFGTRQIYSSSSGTNWTLEHDPGLSGSWPGVQDMIIYNNKLWASCCNGDNYVEVLSRPAGGTFTTEYTSSAYKSIGQFVIRGNDLYLFVQKVSGGTAALKYTEVAPQDPVADISANPTSGNAPLTVNFDASGSYDPDGIIVLYEWDFEDDGTVDDTGVTASHQYTEFGDYTARLTVTDNDYRTGTTTVEIMVEPQPGDLDNDGDVDQQDFGYFQACLSGAGVPQTEPDCEHALLDEDNDVDQDDFAVFQGCISGPNVPADPHCAD